MTLRGFAGVVLVGTVALLATGVRAGEDPAARKDQPSVVKAEPEAEPPAPVADLDEEPPPVGDDGEPIEPRPRRHIQVLENPADISYFYRSEDSEPTGGWTYTGTEPGESPGLALSRMYGGGSAHGHSWGESGHGWGWSAGWVGRECPVHHVHHASGAPVPVGQAVPRGEARPR